MKFILAFIFPVLLIVSCKQTKQQLLDKAYGLSQRKKYDEAIKIYTQIIESNKKLQLAYYNRGFAFAATQQYDKALADFNQVILLQTHGDFIITNNKDLPYASEEVGAQVPYEDALYQLAQIKYHTDSLSSSFRDFQALIDNNYGEKSNCLLWQGTIYLRNHKTENACQYFNQAKQVATTDDDRKQADKMISTYCNSVNNNR